jgi:hypothetical protein
MFRAFGRTGTQDKPATSFDVAGTAPINAH